MAENKREWLEPELIVLVRSKPEEAVLVSCKGNGVGGSALNVISACMLGNCNVACNDTFSS